MAGLRLALFLGVLCSCSVIGLGDTLPPTEVLPVDKVTVGPTVEVEKKTTTTTTPEPDTTTKTTTTTTTTTTPPPPPPPPAPTPPAPPKPLPPPTQGNWPYTDENNVTCIVVQFAAQITVTYSKSVLNTTTIANITRNVPWNATVAGGSCKPNATEQWIEIGWLSDGAPNAILMLFLKNETTKTYALHSFNLTIDGSQLINSSAPADNIVLSHDECWTTPLSTSYRCMPVTRISMSNETYLVSASVAVSGLQEEAFRTAPGKGFSAARDCGSGDVPDAVPIAVGCALGGLVLVVLVAYLVARRRSAARGYLSM